MPKLKVRKIPWRNNYREGVIRGEPLNPSIAIESRYYLNLVHLIKRMSQETEAEIKKLFKSDSAVEFFSEDASIASQARIVTNALIKKFEELFSDNAQPMAEQMAESSNKSASASVHSGIRKLAEGFTISNKAFQTGGVLNEILKATIAENVSLIKSIPSKYFTDVQGAVMRSITSGNGLQDLVPALAKYKEITLRRARMISHDQSRKAFTSLTKQKMLNVGIQQAEWLHTKGSEHPRKSHIAMSGKIFDLSKGMYDPDVGEYIQPGYLVNCRCRYVPVINLGGQ